MRIARRPIDRLLSLVRPMYRYQCSALECGWQGNLSPSASAARTSI